MPNRLANETSPYLRQHQENPVDWYPWGQEALDKARKEDKPIFLSIGYAACHWCHVMAHESFEDPHIAAILNDNFISIKVDREERPDLDDIYMQAVVILARHGGWPMSVFLTPDLQPFFGGTYFPPSPRFGMPSFEKVLLTVLDAWQNQRSDVNKSARSITHALQSQLNQPPEKDGAFDLEAIVDSLYESYDWVNGGWGQAPKFPQPMLVEFLIQRALSGNKQAAELVEHVLDHMARGGMYDLVSGGFHRYSTDAKWLIPHFEKMLYDNAQLAEAYLHGYALTGNAYFRQVAVQTLQFIQREMTSPEGGFYASLDADTPEGEGRYYAYTLETLQEQLTSDEFNQLYDLITLSEEGNFESGLNIIQLKNGFQKLAAASNLTTSEFQNKLEPIFKKLRTSRSTRTAPGRDEKIITGWNAMAIRAFAQAGLMFGNEDFLDTARRASQFLLDELQLPDGRLNRSWSQGKASHPAALEDYAATILALHAVYEVDFASKYFQVICSLHRIMEQDFAAGSGLYFDASAAVGDLIVRPQNLQDNATPSGNALAGHVKWLLGNYEHDSAHFENLARMLHAVAKKANQYPTHFGYWLRIADLAESQGQQIALISETGPASLQPYFEIIHKHYRPYTVVAAKYIDKNQTQGLPGLLEDRPLVEGKPTAYVCQGFSCKMPVTDPKAMGAQLKF